MTQSQASPMTDFMRLCDHRARCYVNGSAYHDKLKTIQPITGGWSVHFKDHPRVIEAEREGWGRELRSAVIAECKQRLMMGLDLGEPDALMPTRRQWWEDTRKNAERYRISAKWQEENLDSDFSIGTITSKILDKMKKPALPPADRDAWNARFGRR